MRSLQNSRICNPGFVSKLSDLLSRIGASNQAIEHLNASALPADAEPLLLVEMAARGLDGFTQDGLDTPRLTRDVRLPAFERCPAAPYVWPRASRSPSLMVEELFKAQAELQAQSKAAQAKALAATAPQEPPPAEQAQSEASV